jgi:choline dehydrogenase
VTAGRSRFDVVVAGGGTAGCVLAARLSEDPERTVCLVEAGPDYGPYAAGRWPADMLDGRRLAFSHAWETDREDRSQLRARILGGCSAHNACVLLEGPPADYDEWGPGWTYAELGPFLRRAREQFAVRVFDEDELSPWHRVFAGRAGGFVHEVNARGAVRWNAAFAYLDEARGRPNLTIRADTLVARVLLDGSGSRATGVETSGGAIDAEAVVLAAGAYGSPGILLRSGVGPERGLPVGEGLCDHVGVGFAWEPTARLQEETARFEAEHPLFMGQATVQVASSVCPDGLWDVFLFPAVDPGYEISGAVFAMKPLSRGQVRLNDADPRTPLSVEHGFLRDPPDAAVLEEGVEVLRGLAAGAEARVYAGRELRPGPEVSAAEHVATGTRGFFHPVGTCALGSVVDASGGVAGLDGLVVADASIMPTIPRVNTNLTVAAIAEKIAETLSGA